MTTPAARKIRLIMMLRQAGVADPDVLSAMELVPRERFVPEIFRDRAYENVALPIGFGQTISQPMIVGIMTEALRVEPRSRVLEIGTGCGYQTAVLARLCRRVYTIERHRPLLRDAEALLADLGFLNVTTRCGDGHQGWPEIAPVDRIIACAAANDVPAALLDQLAEGGILVLPVGERPEGQRLLRITRTSEGFSTEELASVSFVPMQFGAGESIDESARGVTDIDQ